VVQYLPCIQFVPYFVEVEKKPRADNRTKKIRILFILDNDDADIGEAVAKESTSLQALLLSALPPEYRGPLDMIGGSYLTKDAILKRIEGMDVGENDTLLVYANLHGAEKKGEEGAQQFKTHGKSTTTAEKETIARNELLAALRSKGAFLTVLITDSCFGNPRGAATATNTGPFASGRKVRTKFAIDEGPDAGEPLVRPNDVTQRILLDLLINHKGLVNINSSEQGELALTDVFTPAFIHLITREGGARALSFATRIHLGRLFQAPPTRDPGQIREAKERRRQADDRPQGQGTHSSETDELRRGEQAARR
jgi:hypothetical protein